MSNVVVVGMQFGDEGKGKVVDLICPAFDHVVRYQGGHNAGHTVRFADRRFALHLIPSGILHSGIHCYLGNGMVIEPEAFAKELDGLIAAGIEVEGRLWVSDRAHLLSPAHGRLDRAREDALGNDKIGTTSRGIGPAYESKVGRYGLRLADCLDDGFEARLRTQVERATVELGLGEIAAQDLWDETRNHFARHLPRLKPLVADVSLRLATAIASDEPVLFEGAQGTLLDVDHGTYPYVTSSSATAGGAATGAGIAPSQIGAALGILKAYTTRVGAGPFPTERTGPIGERLRKRGNEFGTTTGRPRRCGWLDMVLARYAVRINGIDAIALTKLDVLDDLDEIKIAVAYQVDGETLRELPASRSRLARVEPVYETLPGWRKSTVGTVDFQGLPENARRYVERIEQDLGVPVAVISTGPRREETIVRRELLGGVVGDRLARLLSA